MNHLKAFRAATANILQLFPRLKSSVAFRQRIDLTVLEILNKSTMSDIRSKKITFLDTPQV